MVDAVPNIQKSEDVTPPPPSTDLESNVAKMQTVSTLKVSAQYSEPTADSEKPQLMAFNNMNQTSPQDLAKTLALAQQRIVSDISDSWLKNTQEVAADMQKAYEQKIQQGLDTYSLLVAYLFQQWQNQAAPGVQAGEAGISKVGLTQNALSIGNAGAVAPGVPGSIEPAAFHSHQQSTVGGVGRVDGMPQPVVNNAAVPTIVPGNPQLNKIEPTDNENDLSKPLSVGIGLVGILAAQMPLLDSIAATGIIDSTNAALGVPGTQLFNDLSVQMVSAQILPVDMAGALAMMAALIGTSLVSSSVVALAKSEGTNPDHYNKKYVDAFIEQVQKLVKSPLFDQLIQLTILAQLEARGEKLSPAETSNIFTASKLVYLLSALAAYYKAETGAITSDEIVGLINGQIELSKDDPRTSLVDEINQQRQLLDGDAGARFWDSALAYFDKNPAMKDLLDPTTVFKDMASSDEAKVSAASALSA